MPDDLKKVYYSLKVNNIEADVWLTFMFIRSFNKNYRDDKWNPIGGNIDYDFIEFVKERDIELYSFFETTDEYFADEKGKKGDLNHLAATLTGLMYESCIGDEFKSVVMPKSNIDALCGWAGDLQTAMKDARLLLDKNSDYDTFKTVMKEMIGGDEYTSTKYKGLIGRYDFPIEDVYADVDAANFFDDYSTVLQKDKGTFANILIYYFKEGYKKRYTQFYNNSYDELEVKCFTSFYYLDGILDFLDSTGERNDEVVNHPFYPIVYLVNIIYDKKEYQLKKTLTWPLFNDVKTAFSKEESDAATDAYKEFLMEQVRNEENKN